MNPPDKSAPSIPNLLSLRGSRGGARGGRSRGGPGAGPSRRTGQGHDAVIQGTDTDAAVSRLSAVDLGYLHDPCAQFFVQSPNGPPARRLPIINRGTYTRTSGLDRLIDAFLSTLDAESPKQIVALGAGTDTRPFRIFSQQNCHGLIYHEIDFEVVCSKKLRIVKGVPLLSRVLPDASVVPPADPEEASNSWTSQPSNGGLFYCHGLDLRKLPGNEESLTLPGLRTNVPTLLLSECCLCYLSPQEANGVISFFTAQIPNLATVIYEPIRPDDPFGQVMVSNLAARHIRMPTLDVYREAKDQVDRLSKAGFEVVKHMTIEDIWNSWVTQEEKERVDSLEGLDEVEEWQLLAAHYIIVWGYRGDGFSGLAEE
ncbi:unnamed protein product [Clonostachys byssicola]|uniref:Leucine carboxyl methyltransferase 1 n=1 Tax=Clonostachys byssicola TaxID=160290 RepID=A0A9N9UP34_9HYPO|nr:unnamed protein product [Clonostachys byssicola]